MQWDIFCRVVDNYGDIGVCWRLARQLQQEYGIAVRLWVDHLPSFARLCPAVQPAQATQIVEGVTVLRWDDQARAVPAPVVISAFGCALPETYLADMADQAAAKNTPVWINLEYLSAESWVEGCHTLPSPHPRLPLQQYFFYPGFTVQTGGLLREKGLQQQWQAFTLAEQQVFCHALGIPPRRSGEQMISLFHYPQAPVRALCQAWAAAGQPVTCVFAGGKVPAEIADTHWPDCVRIVSISFLRQSDYDYLLWSCDLNFVRGEDSFVRAQWAQKPFVWQIYPQAEAAHQIKLEVFLQRYLVDVPAPAAQAQCIFWQAWNQPDSVDISAPTAEDAQNRRWSRLWSDFMAVQPDLQARARAWASTLGCQKDLAAQLVDFCQLRLK